MKKILTLMLVIALAVTALAGCSNGNKHDKLVVYFVPSREPEEIISQTEPLKALLKEELMAAGFEFGEVEIQVGTSYEAVGEALSAGTAHVGFIPGGTYVLYDDGAEVILTATRAGLSKDSANAGDWNDGKATEGVDTQVTYYKGLMIAGPSEKGQALVAKINAGEALTKEDVEGVNWGVRSSSSSSGYIYPTIWLQENFGITLTEMPNVVTTDSYGSTMARLASEQIDVGTIYADARRDYAEKWNSEYTREGSIWKETGVIGVTPNIYNDTISVSKTSEIVTPELIKALQDAFINIASTEEGQEVISIYSHEGYKVATSADYDSERKAQDIIKSME